MTIDKLLSYNAEGLIPGPAETEDFFLKRVDYCLHLREKIGETLPFEVSAEASKETVLSPCKQVRALYDIEPAWVPVFFSNYQLAPWHGGCAWIFQLHEQEPTAAFFQLRRRLQNSQTYLGIYDRDELMAHELVHVGRMMFEEPRYEEILAYRTSFHSWRRWWGPLVQSSAESAWFVFLLLPLLLLDAYLLLSGDLELYTNVMWLKLLPLGLVAAAVVRLYRRQSTFSSALKNLQGLFNEGKAEAVIYRLTDHEIESFAGMSVEEIREYIDREGSLRWAVIKKAYQTGSF